MTALPRDIPVLLVDDSMMMRQIVHDVLAGLGYTQISSAENGAIALEKMMEAKKSGIGFGLVILDWNMPEMDGISFLKICRADPAFDKVAFVMVTAVGGNDNMVKALEIGATAYIYKPITPESLTEKIKQVTKWWAEDNQ